MSEDLEKRTRQYIMLRDKIKALKDEHTKQLKPYHDALAQIENVMLTHLTAVNADNVKTSAGTFYKSVQVSATINDGNEFTRHVIGAQAWDLVDWRANKTAVQAILDAGGPLPPGLNYSTYVKVGVRRANESSE